jgi:hypothetical protein
MPPAAPADRRSLASIWLALLVAALVVAVLGVIVVLSLGSPSLLVGIAIGGGVFALGGLQYFVWGRWLRRVLREREDAENSRDSYPKDSPPTV